MSFFRDSVGGALDWAHNWKEDTNARLNAANNRAYLLGRIQDECVKAGFKTETVRQPAIFPAMQVAVQLGSKDESELVEVGGEGWTNIVFAVTKLLAKTDEATVFVQLDAREARAYVCCTQKRDGIKRPRAVTIADVTDPYSLAAAYRAARKERR